MAEVRFEGVRKHYGDVVALDGFDVTAGDGELLVLVGPSGSGKTTALRIAAGLEELTGGVVRIGGRDVTRVPPAKRNVAMVFQNFALFPHLKVADNIGFGLRARGIGRADAARRVREAADVVGCGDLLDRRPTELSGGERQRVALARALVREPDVFLLDEPLSNLDPHLRAQMRVEIRRLHDRVGGTMIHVTHDQVEALTLGDRVAVVNDGIVQQVAPPDDLYRRPANRFVATFVGNPAMNVIPAELRGGVLAAGPFGVPLPARAPADRPLEVGVRPEDVVLGSAASGDTARVVLVEVAGSDVYVHVEVAGRRMIVRGEADRRPAVGDRVGLTLRHGRTHVFDAETGAVVR